MSIEDFRDTDFYKYKWLSNFWPVEVEFDGETYPSTEHAYQAAKTLIPEERMMVRRTSACGAAKKMGAAVTLRKDWEEIKIGVMHDLVRQKFTKHSYLKEKLILTGRHHLVEGNTWNDKFWGVCDGEGENHLGRILMDVRAEILGLPVARRPE